MEAGNRQLKPGKIPVDVRNFATLTIASPPAGATDRKSTSLHGVVDQGSREFEE
jgi:hypothetical protein